jgi:hypothetical protein
LSNCVGWQQKLGDFGRRLNKLPEASMDRELLMRRACEAETASHLAARQNLPKPPQCHVQGGCVCPGYPLIQINMPFTAEICCASNVPPTPGGTLATSGTAHP